MTEEFKPRVKRAHSEALDDKIRRGYSLLKARRDEEALKVFNEVIAVNRENSQVYFYASEALRKLRQYEQALEYLNRCLEINPTNPLAYLAAGEICLRLKNWDQALENFHYATKLDSNSAAAYLGIGKVLHEQRQYDQAIEVFDKVLILDANPKAYAALAKTYLAKMDQEDGIIDLRNDDIIDLLNRGAKILILEEEDLHKLLDSSSHEELEERIADIQYINAWLKSLINELNWQVNYIKKAIKSSGRYIIPEGMQEGFEDFL